MGARMRGNLQWFGFVAAFTAVTAATLLCATVETFKWRRLKSPWAPARREHFFTDEILAMGRPDADLSRRLGREHVVAFLGRRHTYLLSEGGEELERIAELNLDGKRLEISASSDIYMREKHVFGELILKYAHGTTATEPERQELKRGGFEESRGGRSHQKRIQFRGVVLPAIQLTSGHGGELSIPRTIHIAQVEYSQDAGEMAKIVAADLGQLAYAIIIDVAFAPISIPMGVMLILKYNKKH